ncbi:MAG: HD domain-containing protein [Anaerolineales bacterium]|nr:HD domain-containing protein [Anaerolineales bacterium]
MPEQINLPDLTPYAGRWVALARDQVAGVGHTPEEAERMARHNRPKERFVLWFVDPPDAAPLPLPALLARLRPFLAQQPEPVYLVGGAVRDALLGRPSHDLDFVVPRRGIALAFAVADALGVPAFPLDKARDTGRVMLAETTLDFACFRGPDLAADLRDRDFTVNAIALPATAVSRAALIDPCGGLADLEAGQLRLTHPGALAQDALRALRGVRHVVGLGLTLLPETAQALRAAAPELRQVSVERVRDELQKLLETAAPDTAVALLAELGLLAPVLPEIAALAPVTQSAPHHEPVLAHTVSVLRRLAAVERVLLAGEAAAEGYWQPVVRELGPYREPLRAHLGRTVDGLVDGRVLLRLGALFHDVGKAQTREEDENGRVRFFGHAEVGAKLAARALRRLTFGNRAVAHVAHIVAAHMRPLFLAEAQGGRPTRRAVYRFFRDIQSAGLDVGLLALADHLATYDGPGDAAAWEQLVRLVGELFRHYFERHDEVVAPTPLLDGHALMAALQLAPGREVGRLLRLIEEAQAAGLVTTPEEAVALARQAQAG